MADIEKITAHINYYEREDEPLNPGDHAVILLKSNNRISHRFYGNWYEQLPLIFIGKMLLHDSFIKSGNTEEDWERECMIAKKGALIEMMLGGVDGEETEK